MQWDTGATVFAFIAAAVLLLLVVGVVYDLMARRRGTYRSSSEWLAMSRRRKSHFRESRAGEARPKSDRAGGARPKSEL